MLAKEDHQKSVNEVEKCHAVMMCQFGKIKQTHERLEQNGKCYTVIVCFIPHAECLEAQQNSLILGISQGEG